MIQPQAQGVPATVAWRNATGDPRVCAAAAYDAARPCVVVFGGAQGVALQAGTWEWNGTQWRQGFPATVPAARHEHAMAFDALTPAHAPSARQPGSIRRDRCRVMGCAVSLVRGDVDCHVQESAS
jgi:hypothetical protein